MSFRDIDEILSEIEGVHRTFCIKFQSESKASIGRFRFIPRETVGEHSERIQTQIGFFQCFLQSLSAFRLDG